MLGRWSTRPPAESHVKYLNTEHYEEMRAMAAEEDLNRTNHWTQAFKHIEGTTCVLIEREVSEWRRSDQLTNLAG